MALKNIKKGAQRAQSAESGSAASRVAQLAPPASPEAEASLLGSILMNQDVCADVTELVSPDDFYYPKHKIIAKNNMGAVRLQLQH